MRRRILAGAAIALGAAALSPLNARADDSGGAEPVTFNNQIVRLFQASCQNCHRPDQMAPMSLVTYEEARPWAKSIREAVVDRYMPPFHADPAIGKWTNDISLSQEQIDLVTRWVDAGAPRGNPDDLPPPIQWPDNEWYGGEPDLVLQAETFSVPPTGEREDLFRCFVLPTGLTEDTWIQGIELRSGDPRVVHHLLAFIDNGRTAERLDEEAPGPGYPCDMGGIGVPFEGLAAGHAPGTPPTIYREGNGKLARAGSNIVLQLHYYNSTGETVQDASIAGVHFAKTPVKQQLRVWPVSQFDLNIRAGDSNAENVATWKLRKDIEISGFMPHMHFLGKDMTIYLDFEDGTTETILSVPRFDFNWQIAYGMAEPRVLTAGTTLRVVGHHDNSAENPNNPNNPPVDVTFGESTGEEMMIGWVSYVDPHEDLTKPKKKTR